MSSEKAAMDNPLVSKLALQLRKACTFQVYLQNTLGNITSKPSWFHNAVNTYLAIQLDSIKLACVEAQNTVTLLSEGQIFRKYKF